MIAFYEYESALCNHSQRNYTSKSSASVALVTSRLQLFRARLRSRTTKAQFGIWLHVRQSQITKPTLAGKRPASPAGLRAFPGKS